MVAALALLVVSSSLAAPENIVKECILVAQKAWNKGDNTKTVRALEKALMAARKTVPLEVRKVVVTRKPSKGLGVYEASKGAHVEFGVLWLYVEVANYSLQKAGDAHEISLSLSGEFFVDGESIGTKELGEHKVKTYSDVGVTSFGLDVRLGGDVPKGPYEVELTVTDGHTFKSAKKRTQFNIR